MDNRIQEAITLRKTGEYDKSRALLMTVAAVDELKAEAFLHIAWSYDNQGEEAKAVEYYVAALDEGLQDEDRFEALFGLASTYRCLGRYSEAEQMFELVSGEYPEATEVIPFYALCLHNLGKHEQAMSLMLALIAKYPPTPDIARYCKALELYSKYPDKIW